MRGPGSKDGTDHLVDLIVGLDAELSGGGREQDGFDLGLDQLAVHAADHKAVPHVQLTVSEDDVEGGAVTSKLFDLKDRALEGGELREGEEE